MSKNVESDHYLGESAAVGSAPRRNAWDQRDGESGRAFAAFKRFRDFGPDRSLGKVYRAFQQAKCRRQRRGSKAATERQQPPGCWTKWSHQFDWVTRARAFDRRLDAVGQAARLAEAARQTAMLERRRAQHLRREQKLLNHLYKAALEGIKSKTISKDLSSVVRAIKELSRIGRINCSLPLDNGEVPTDDNGAATAPTVIRIRPVVVNPTTPDDHAPDERFI